MEELTGIETIALLTAVIVMGFASVYLILFLIHWYILRKKEEIGNIINDIKKEKRDNS